MLNKITQPLGTYTIRAKEEIKFIFAIEPVISNMLLISICFGAIYILDCKSITPNLGKIRFFIYHGLQMIAALQVVFSAKKSLFLPLISLLVGIIGIILSRV